MFTILMIFQYFALTNHIHTFITVIYTIEFQKRGLPHAHILIFLHPQSKYLNPIDIDKIISYKFLNPDLHPRLYNLVKQHMMHDPCELSRLSSPCIKNR